VHAVTPCLTANVYQPRGGTYPETVARTLATVREPWLREFKRLGRRCNVAQRFLLRIERLLLGKYQQRVVVAAVSDYVRQQVVALGFPEQRVRVVFNGVDVAPFEPDERVKLRVETRTAWRIAADEPVALFAAHNFRLKGLDELLRATALAFDDGGLRWRVVVAGRDRTPPYARLARVLKIGDRVHFIGADTPMRAAFAAVDVVAHPTWYDPCSRVVLEALSLGVPTVTTWYNGAAEVLEPGRHGALLAEPRDIAGLTRAVRDALQPEVQAACAADAPRMHAQLSMARHARQLLGLYDAVCRASRA
jgi:UDP-glucose:(heptosyl)LPS alpha-1,3-glucosyltransferase